MQSRIDQSIDRFRRASGLFIFRPVTVIDSNGEPIENNMRSQSVFDKAIELLSDKAIKLLSELKQDTTLKEEKKLDKHDAIVFGAVIYALHKELQEATNPSDFGLTLSSSEFQRMYKETLNSLSSEQTKEDFKLIPAIGHKILREQASPDSFFKSTYCLGQIITDCIPDDRFNLYKERYEERQLYLKVYEIQERLHRLRRYAGRALAILAAIIPPLSLIFTIRHALGKHDSSPSWWRVLFAAIIPIFSTTESLRAIKYIDRNNHSKDPIQKVTWLEKDWEREKQERKQFKDLTWGIINPHLEQGRKPEKVVISYEKNKCRFVDIYRDVEQISRPLKIICKLAPSLHGLEDKKKKEEAIKFFKTSYAESRKLVDELKTKYSVRR